MKADIAALLYLVSGVLFILALKGLASPATSRTGNRNGMIGMALAVGTTLWVAGVTDALTWGLIVGGVAIGGGIGAITAKRIAMTAMPQLVAAFHSLVGLAAVLVAAAALYSPEAYGIGIEGAIRAQSLIEMSIGVAIGAITFSGSVIAFAKLNGNMSGAPIILPARHVLNILIFVGHYRADRLYDPKPASLGVLGHCGFKFPLRHHPHYSHWRCRYAGGGVDAEFLFRLGGGGYRFHAGKYRAHHYRRLGRFIGCDPVLHYVQGHEPQFRLCHYGRVRRRDRPALRARPKRVR